MKLLLKYNKISRWLFAEVFPFKRYAWRKGKGYGILLENETKVFLQVLEQQVVQAYKRRPISSQGPESGRAVCGSRLRHWRNLRNVCRLRKHWADILLSIGSPQEQDGGVWRGTGLDSGIHLIMFDISKSEGWRPKLFSGCSFDWISLFCFYFYWLYLPNIFSLVFTCLIFKLSLYSSSTKHILTFNNRINDGIAVMVVIERRRISWRNSYRYKLPTNVATQPSAA